MGIRRIARAELTVAALARLHWENRDFTHATPYQTAHLLTMLGSSAERGTIFTLECRADRGDPDRYCALYEACQHATSDNDYESYDDRDEMICPDGGRHIMFQSRDDDGSGWYRDTRRCRFAHYGDLTEPVDELNLKRGIYFVEVSSEDWQAGEVTLGVIATVGEPVEPGMVSISAQATGDDRLSFGLESDIREILCAELEDEVDYDFEDGAVTINVAPAVFELVRYLEGQPRSGPIAQPVNPTQRRPIATIETGGLL